MNNIVISNKGCYGHLEVIESIIHKYPLIIRQTIHSSEEQIFIDLKDDVDKSFIKYISEKYPKIKFGLPKIIHFTIYITFYPNEKSLNMVRNKDPQKNFFICHRVFKERENYPNIFFLTPLSINNFISANILPFESSKKKNTDIPIFVIQGNFSECRRDYNLLKVILKHKFEYPFKIKLLGRGDIPKIVKSNPDLFIICQNKNFIEYHQELNDCYCIMTLITRKRNKKYYKGCLTSTINYALAYNLKCIIDSQLQDIYHLPNVEVYQKPRDIVNAFGRALKYFFSKKNKRIKELSNPTNANNEQIIDTKTNEEVSVDNQESNSNEPFSMFFKRPRGRAPKGKSWDQEKGIWV